MNITVNKFKGTAPKIEPRLLSPEYAQISTNIRYDSGSLVPINDFEYVELAPADIETTAIYKYNNTVDSSRWLYFTSDVLLVKDPIYTYPDDRVIISGMGAPRIFDRVLLGSSRNVTVNNSYLLGLPVPDAPVIAVQNYGDGYSESRAYTVQYDRLWGTDSKLDQGPYSSPASTVGGKYFVDLTTNGTAIISGIKDAPAGHGVTHISINRSSSTVQNSNFHFLRTFNIADAKAGLVAGVTWNSLTGTFSVADSAAAYDLGQVCTNSDYYAPADSLKGIIAVSSGMLAGYTGNSVCFSEPYQCHAWPEQYRVSIGKPVVGLGYFGDIVVVCTDAEPYIINISDPATAVAFPIKDFAPCLSATGIVSYRDAVVYPSEAGLMRVDRTGVVNLTADLADIRDMKEFNLNNVRAAGLGFYYYALYTTDSNQRRMLILNMQDPAQGFGMCDSNILCIYSDFETASLYAAYKTAFGDQRLGIFDRGGASLVSAWKSKIFLSKDDTTHFSAARVHFDTAKLATNGTSAATVNLNYAINTFAYNINPINGAYGTSSIVGLLFSLYVDGHFVFLKHVTDTKPFRLPAGIVGKDVEIVLGGSVPVYRVDLASSMTELTAE